MNPQNRSYGFGYSDSVKIFSDKELEELLFGYPSSPSESRGFWDWAFQPHSTPASPPALATLSGVPSPLPSSEEIPKAALAFYAFIEGEYDPRLFVPDPLNYFSKEGASSAIKPKKHHQRRRRHPYYLRPRDSNGRAITARRLN
ncbi:hypothetical protein O181_089020 [Austropuccinia psidii MF-1]|uniref:Uncharacterized protein n=1 Tax=Austropuccinia psidii MF-1 TaxID=1389203 RepID=A0A9Q3P516_9BASI|nr:hypothetical protein [Austropuccinia psidii MF-1]